MEEANGIVGTLSREDWFAGIRAGAYVMEDGVPTMREFWLPNDPVVGGWCEVHVRGWAVPFLGTAVGAIDEGCVEEAVSNALDALGVSFDQMPDDAGIAPQEPSQPPTGASGDGPATEEERTELNNLVLEVAMARNVSFVTAKAALMKSDAAAGIDGRAPLTSAQVASLKGQLERWLEVSRG